MLAKMAEIDRWIEITKECNYLPENDLKVKYMTVLNAYLTIECL